MTYTIPPDSPKAATAKRFGDELRRVMTERRVSARQLEAALGRRLHTTIYHWRRGAILPRLAVAAELAEALAAPRLLEIVREARSSICEHCGRSWTFDGGSGNKRYCTAGCRDAAAKNRGRLARYEQHEARAYQANDPDRALVARLKQELERVRGGTAPVSRKELRAAIEQYERSAPQGRLRRAQGLLDEHMTAVEAMCRGCEPEGLCRAADCALRTVSPLPVVPLADIPLAEPWHHGGNTPEARERGRQRRSASLLALYQREPERRQAHSERSRNWWAGLSPAERVEMGRKIAEHRRGRATVRACGCPNRAHRDDCPLLREAAS